MQHLDILSQLHQIMVDFIFQQTAFFCLIWGSKSWQEEVEKVAAVHFNNTNYV